MTSNSSTTCPIEQPPDLALAKGAAYGYMILGSIGFISNIFINYVIFQLRLFRVMGHLIIISLSVSGMIMSAIVSTFYATELLTDSGVTVSQSWCQVSAAVSILAVSTTCLNLVGISIDRCIAIFFPLHYPQIVTAKGVYACLLCMWVFMFTWSFLPVFGWNGKQTCLRVGYTICDWGNTLDFDFFIATSIIVLSAVIIVIIMQTSIYVLAIKQARKLYGKDTSQEASRRNDLAKAQRKITRVVAFIVVTFFVTYTPWFSLSIRTVVTQIGGQKIIISCAFLLFSNAMLNPLVYASSDSVIRKKALSLLHVPGSWNNNVHPASSE